MTKKKQIGVATFVSRTVQLGDQAWGFGWAPENSVIDVSKGLSAKQVWQQYCSARELMGSEPLHFVVEFEGEPVESFEDGIQAAQDLATGETSEVEIWVPSKDPSSSWQKMKADWDIE